MVDGPRVTSPVTAFWWNLVTNWGDRLSPIILRRFAHVEPLWAPADRADVVCIGSVLGNLVKPDYTGVVLGAGKLFEHGIVPARARILALRGPLTAKGVKGDFALGDPGLLADELIAPEPKRHALGIVPHWSDRWLSQDPRFAPFDPLIIHSASDPLGVIRQIARCRKIVSSSLHGLIVADAYAIPRRFEASAQWVKEGGSFKVDDYNASVGLETKVGVVQVADWNRVIDLKNSLLDAFEAYHDLAGAATSPKGMT